MQVDILAFAAHPDDIELSASGTIIKHIAMGKKVAIVDLTQGELGSRGTIDSRYEEADDAMNIMGVHARENLKMRDGFFTISEENKLKVVAQIRRFKPQIVLANAISDRHPDHGRGSQLVREACFLAGLQKIKTTWDEKTQEHWRPKAIYFYIQDRYIKPDFIVDISAHIDQKIESIKAYKTQFFNPDMEGPLTPISGEDFFDFLKGRWKEFGRTIGTNYGEGFTVERTHGVKDITDLL